MNAFAALADVLRQLEHVITPLDDEEFTARESAASGTIGAHVRHCLDHVWALERGIATGELSYDYRQRNTVVENEPALAISRLRRAQVRLGGVDDSLLDRPLALTSQIHDDGRAVRATTTVGRELAFVISHTVHHSALVAVLLEQRGRALPARFGLAPTTPLRAACAQ